MSRLSLGVIGTSAKENEHRLPLHPEHLARLAPEVAARTTLEHGYADRFGIGDEDLAPHVAGFATRDEILERSDVVVLPKPQHEDVAKMHPEQVLWGWPHCVQDTRMTQLAIDRELTLIAFEAMNHWTSDGYVGLHGVGDVAVLTTRGVAAVGSPIHSVLIRQFDHDPDDPGASQVITDRGRVPLAPYLAENDIVVNCTLQDTAAPLTYLQTDDLAAFRQGSLIVDVSCDEGMGFEWAVPTTFDDPMFTVGDRVHYYAVDHSPSYLWNSATWENSEALLPFVDLVLSGPDAWDSSETISRAIEIREGRILNPAILAFPGRSSEHPYVIG